MLSLQLHIPGARSLKQKRAVLRSVKDRLRKLNVAVAEIGHQDSWQRSSLGIVAVGNTQSGVEQALEAVVDTIERRDPGLVVDSEFEWLT